MTNTNNPDEVINKLFAKLQEKKKQIESIERPQWRTNFSFAYNPQEAARVNIQTCGVDQLVDILGFLLSKESAWNQASKMLELKSDFKWQTFSMDDWLHDIKTRVAKISIDSKKKEYKQLEDKLNALVSPEQRRLMELEAISKLLAD